MTAPVDSLDAIFEAAAELGAVVAIPGLLHWRGLEWRPVEDSEETYEAYLDRISREAA